MTTIDDYPVSDATRVELKRIFDSLTPEEERQLKLRFVGNDGTEGAYTYLCAVDEGGRVLGEVDTESFVGGRMEERDAQEA